MASGVGCVGGLRSRGDDRVIEALALLVCAAGILVIAEACTWILIVLSRRR